MSYGHALYYPSINITNKNWLKTALLFWDKLSRIVPASVQPSDSEEIIRINEEFNFIENYAPDNYFVSKAFNNFGRWLENEFPSRLFQRLHHLPPRGSHHYPHEMMDDPDYRHFIERYRHDPDFRSVLLAPFTSRHGSFIHVQKMDERLKILLFELGLAIPGDDPWSDWVKIDNEIGFMYMAYLAKSISLETNRPIVTDITDSFASSLSFEPYVENTKHSNNSFECNLATLLIDIQLPTDINRVSIDKVIEFRRQFEEERTRFFEHINGLGTSLHEISSKGEMKDALGHYFNLQVTELEKLRKGYDKLGIQYVSTFFAISVPAAASIASYVQSAWSGIFGGVSAGFLIANDTVGKEKDKLAGQPLSYLLSIESEFSRERFLEKLQDRVRGLRKSW